MKAKPGYTVTIDRDESGDPVRLRYDAATTTTHIENASVGGDTLAPAAPVPTHAACPFCNCAAGLIPYVDYGLMKYRIGCDTCDTQGGLYDTEVHAWHAWDMRGGAALFTAEDRKRAAAADVTALFEEVIAELQDHGAPLSYAVDVRLRLARAFEGRG